MAEPLNYLIGRGETLISPISYRTGGGSKSHPYTFAEAVERLSPQLTTVAQSVAELPSLACPSDEAVVSVTLHPTYLAKSYHPTNLLNGLGLRQVGSREQRLVPSKWTTKEPPDGPLVAPELFIAGPRKTLENLGQYVARFSNGDMQDDFRKIEVVQPLGNSRVRPVSGEDLLPPVEIVLHGDIERQGSVAILTAFQRWCEQLGVDSDFSNRQEVGGLEFLGLHVPRSSFIDLAKFAFLRSLRRMPRLAYRDIALRETGSGASFAVTISDEPPHITNIRVAVFDGGLPDSHPFGPAVSAMDAPGLSSPIAEALEHGAQVTSALLYGPLLPNAATSAPFTSLDHWRVIDDSGDDFDLYHTLERIMDVLQQEHYDFVSLSIGPDEALLDDDVHPWTAKLDQYASTSGTLIISAAGNNGDYLGADCRVQPSSDGVNVLAVGASDSVAKSWKRAPYSAKGPGRSPGLVKPDVLAFGGSEGEPFFAVGTSGQASGTSGTSFSAPSTTRLATGLKALFGDQLHPLAVKALLIHRADAGEHAQVDVGWGCLPNSLGEIATCEGSEATVVYQGFLEPARFRRFFLPVPQEGFEGRVRVRATFVTATEVDPEDAINYTRTGVGITFRPVTVGHPGYSKVKGVERERAVHKPETFFGRSKVFETEAKLRDDAHRWEAVMRAEASFASNKLAQPVFDIEHLARANGQGVVRDTSVAYTLVVSLFDPSTSDLYNRVIRTYAGRLAAMRPQIEIPIAT